MELDVYRDAEMAARRNYPCARCRTLLFYNRDLDAWWCPRCDTWAEETCGRDECVQCAARPLKPSQARIVLIA